MTLWNGLELPDKNIYFRDETDSVIIYCADARNVLPLIPDKSIDLVLTDPPYNIGKDIWDKIPNYIEWCSKWVMECQRVLKDNGSFYFFHNDMMQVAQLMEWIRQNTKFIFKQFIVWNKRFDGVANKGFLDGFVETGGLRNYQQMAEYCLFYTLQDDDLEQWIYKSREGVVDYLYGEINKSGLTQNELRFRMGLKMKGGGLLPHWIAGKQPSLIPRHHYLKMQEILQSINPNILARNWEELKMEYENNRINNIDIRYTFNNQKTHHSVWNYEIAERNGGHITPKPTELIKNIIKHSSNENDLILDPFLGSGTTAYCAKKLGRKCIGIEISEKYCEIAKLRCSQSVMRLEVA